MARGTIMLADPPSAAMNRHAASVPIPPDSAQPIDATV
jgi:hypothetical protein